VNSEFVDLWEFLLLPIYIGVILGVSYFTAPKADRRIFLWAMAARMGGALFFASIYLFYYKGGDTLAYFTTAKPFVNLFLKQPASALEALFSPYSLEHYLRFDADTGYPLKYIYMDSQTFTVSRIITPFLLVSGNGYLLATVLLSAVSFIGPWKLYGVFKDAFPDRRIAAISALFIPSVVFWGTGISKDTVTFTSAMYFIHGFYYTFIKRNIKIGRILGSLLALYLVIAIKPYIFIALLPGIVLWLLSSPIANLKNAWLRRFTIPIIAVISSLFFVLIFQQINDLLGVYAADQILEKALVTQDDLKRDYYGGNTFDIGEIDPSFAGVLAKFPIATLYGLYGPTLLTIRNIIMLFSALENTILLALTLRILFTFRFRRIIAVMMDNHILLFSIVFVLLFAFSIGFTTPNYGAMVRFKIPLLPFFVYFLLVMYEKIKPSQSN
jgi:hypothetical protein